MSTDNSYNWHQIDLRWLAVAASLLLSGFMLLLGWVPNEDAFTYIRTVEVFRENGILAAFEHYPWATYPVLIGVVNGLLGIDPFTAAILINACFYCLLAFSFISLVAELSNTGRTILLAAITVLVYPQLNEFRIIVIRDIAFWALSMTGLWQYLLWVRNLRLRNSVMFVAVFLLAAAFRVEALLFLFAVPVSLLADDRLEFPVRVRLMSWLVGSTVGLLLLLALLLNVAGLNVGEVVGNQLSAYVPFLQGTLFADLVRAAELSNVLFGEYATNFSGDFLALFMLAGLLTLLLVTLYKGIGGPWLLVMLAGYLRKVWHLPRWQLNPLLTVILVNALIAFGFVVTTRFLSSRYVMLMCVVIAVFIPIILDRLLQYAKRHGGEHWVRRLIGLLLIYCAIDAYISFGTDRSYLRVAGEWIDANTPPSIELMTNNRVVAYYSGRVEDYDVVRIAFTEAEILQAGPGTLSAFEVDNATNGLFTETPLRSAVEEVQRFGPESSRQVVLYRRL